MLLLIIAGTGFTTLGIMTIVASRLDPLEGEFGWMVFWVTLEILVGLGLIVRGVTLW